MFYHIEGTVAELAPNLAVVDCGGVGYAVNTTANTLSRLEPGKKAKLYVFDYVKEDCFELYGFFTKSEKRCFEMLITVSGVGPKAAVSILSAVTPETLAMESSRAHPPGRLPLERGVLKELMDMETLVIPNIDNVYARERAKDELPQSGSGKTIMTSEPKFVPEQAAQVHLPDGTEVSVRLVDCVGYMVPGAAGQFEDGAERLVTTPWFDHGGLRAVL